LLGRLLGNDLGVKCGTAAHSRFVTHLILFVVVAVHFVVKVVYAVVFFGLSSCVVDMHRRAPQT